MRALPGRVFVCTPSAPLANNNQLEFEPVGPFTGVRFVCHVAAGVAISTAICAAQAQQPELRWGGDAEGGAPYVEADPTNPSKVVGFEVEVAQLLAAGLGRTPRFVQAGFASLEASVARGDFDIVLDGIEDTPTRRARFA